MDNKHRVAVLGLLFLSGFCSLAYQTLWVKQLSLIIGVDVYAIAIVISGFFMGLGIGSYYFARRAQEHANPGRLYGRLEIASALSALALMLILQLGAPLYIEWERAIGTRALALFWLLLAVPPFFMAGTFLALLRYCRSGQADVGRFVGQLYGANTCGAVLGTLCTPFILIPTVGILGAGIFSVCINLFLAFLARGLHGTLTPYSSGGAGHTGTDLPHWTAAGLYGLVGFSAIAYEVIWGQMIIQFLDTRAHAYAIMLAVYLSGLALGNLLISRKVDRIDRLWLIFSLLCFLAVLTVVLPVALVSADLLAVQENLGELVFEATNQLGLSVLAQFLFISVFFIFIPTCCFGAMFPVVAKLAATRQGHETQASGHALALNTLGGVLASLVFGFWVIPVHGLLNAVSLASTLLTCVALASLVMARFRWHLALAYVAVVVIALVVPRDKFARLLVEQEGGRLMYFSEGIGNTVAVIEQGDGERQFRRLYIEGISNTGDVMASRRYMRLQSYIPLLLSEHPADSALVIGMGTGITSGALLNAKSLTTRHVVELLPEVVEASRYFDGNYSVFDSQDVEIFIGDGRHELLRSQRRYDLITLEPPPPTAAGVNNLYSSDFYELCKTRLSDKGILAQWWPISTQSLDASRSMVRSMLDSFAHVTLWTTELHEMLMVGSMQPLKIDMKVLAKRIEQQPAMAQSLIEVGINSPEALLATYMMSEPGLAAFAGTAPPITDNFPRLEYDRWTSKRVILEILPELLAGQETLENLPKGVAEKYRFEQEKLLAFYYAGLASYAGDRDTWTEMMKRLNRADQDNAYYAWFRSDR